MTDTVSRSVYFVSESTGITAEAYGQSLLSQFGDARFIKRYTPFINTREKAQALANELAHRAEAEGKKPIVFATMVDEEINTLLKHAECHYFELFDRFMPELTEALGMAPVRQSGISHGLVNPANYEARIETINYALHNDDGMRLNKFGKADVILVGVSRSGKTPTCLYLALHYGMRAANYPITEEDFEKGDLPDELLAHKKKIFALTIEPERLAAIRELRRPNSDYASLRRCYKEVQMAQDMFHRHGMTVLDSTTHSIEELASLIKKSL
ncbi:MAG: kinase/pyrophosphorylase [Chromatiaceae bacterium]|nr:kinase/pyrophosphorylase [Chromatiaceae bacterium]MCP5437960.1 kinase/pyrophosphorylase [Chromatiaceae bacterium]MCP5440284.1 kinase/pyrophosphorylase [Chromatiaceae bacterium]HPE78642.1 pyruvate, water dikinase regulatory protein [Gammaproteobacteria bacterium]